MRLTELKDKVEYLIKDLKDNGNFSKENNIIDYKLRLNIDNGKSAEENFLINFSKDILSFTNGDGGIMLIGFEEDKPNSRINDIGLDEANFELLEKIDIAQITQKFEKIAKVGVSIDLQSFRISTRKFYYLLIEKHSSILVPQVDYLDYKLSKGDIYYRASGKNEQANRSTTDFNRFLQIKANEKNKEFMDIWSKLLPEMFDINPREVLILNPHNNKVYGYNSKDNILSSSEIEIDHAENGIFNIILNAISAGEIGKISNDEGKPIYKIVGELKTKTPRDFIYFSSMFEDVKKGLKYNLTSNQLKYVFKYLEWISDETIPIENPDCEKINTKFNQLLWIETLDKTQKVVFSKDAIAPLIEVINNEALHNEVFGRELQKKKVKK